MANPEHVAILQQGENAWNAWQAQHRDDPDLSGADLSKADLSKANLILADLSRANLLGANLSGANLYDANLLGANLSGANLHAANLSGTNLSWTDLSGADLRAAVFTKARLHETVFGNTDLTSAQELETCVHTGPSTLDHRTLAKSGSLPLAFLRGCGLPDVRL